MATFLSRTKFREFMSGKFTLLPTKQYSDKDKPAPPPSIKPRKKGNEHDKSCK